MDGSCPLSDAERIALDALAIRFSTASTRKQVLIEARRFFRYLAARGIDTWKDVAPDVVADYCWAPTNHRGPWRPVSPRTAANRQWVITAVTDTLADLGINATGDIVGHRIPRDEQAQRCRPLADDEVDLVRAHAETGLITSSRSLLVVLAEAGASAPEIATVTGNDVDLIEGTVHLHGGSPRTNPLTDWGIATLRARRDLEPNQPMCVDQHLPLERAAHSITVRLRDVLRDAGLAGRHRVSPRSIPLTQACRILDTHGIEAAARFLGNRSLDATVRALGHRWQHE